AVLAQVWKILVAAGRLDGGTVDRPAFPCTGDCQRSSLSRRRQIRAPDGSADWNAAGADAVVGERIILIEECQDLFARRQFHTDIAIARRGEWIVWLGIDSKTQRRGGTVS